MGWFSKTPYIERRLQCIEHKVEALSEWYQTHIPTELTDADALTCMRYATRLARMEKTLQPKRIARQVHQLRGDLVTFLGYVSQINNR